MANVLSKDKRAIVVNALAEGASIRAVERMTGVHRDIMRLGVRVGKGCCNVLDRLMRNIVCDYLQLDEIWGFVKKKQKRVKPHEVDIGDTWTFVALEAESEAVPCFRVGKRDSETAEAFVRDLSDRLANRVQISTAAVALHFGYYNLVKVHGSVRMTPAMALGATDKLWSIGNPVEAALAETKCRTEKRCRT